jgi:Fe-S-cluster containining protein
MDLRKITAADIGGVEVDSTEQVVRVKLERHLGTGLEEYVESLPIDNEVTNAALLRVREAARHLYTQIEIAVKSRAIEQGEMPCATCTGACCRSWSVLVTPSDLRRIELAVGSESKVRKYVEEFGSADVNGNVARMRKVRWKNPMDGSIEMACAGLAKDGTCGIYEMRPTICREFSPWGCDTKEEWLNVPKKRRLKVLQSGA